MNKEKVASFKANLFFLGLPIPSGYHKLKRYPPINLKEVPAMAKINISDNIFAFIPITTQTILGSHVQNKVKPFVLSMPDNRFWALGECVGKAWQEGKGLKKD